MERMYRATVLTALSVAILLMAGALAQAEDWPWWRGKARDGISRETGLLSSWPEGGPPVRWQVEGLGKGYASVAVVDGVVYTTGMEGGAGIAFAIDAEGNLLWRQAYGPEWKKSYPGSRSTPTYADGKLYIFSGQGRLVCLAAADGAEVWAVDTAARFGARNINWGIAESVLIAGKRVICTPGGAQGSVVALDRQNGEVVWVADGHGEKSAYCSPLLVQQGETRLVVTMTAKSIIGLDGLTGKVLWRHPHETKYDVHAVTPVFADGLLYCSSGYGSGGVMLRLAADGKSVTELWRDKTLDCHHGGVVYMGGHIYGSGHKNGGKWVCLEAATGTVKYTASGVGKGSIIAADGMLYCYGERGKLGLVKADPSQHRVVSQFKVNFGSGEHWAHPALSGGVLYVRRGHTLVAYDIKRD